MKIENYLIILAAFYVLFVIFSSAFLVNRRWPETLPFFQFSAGKRHFLFGVMLALPFPVLMIISTSELIEWQSNRLYLSGNFFEYFAIGLPVFLLYIGCVYRLNYFLRALLCIVIILGSWLIATAHVYVDKCNLYVPRDSFFADYSHDFKSIKEVWHFHKIIDIGRKYEHHHIDDLAFFFQDGYVWSSVYLKPHINLEDRRIFNVKLTSLCAIDNIYQKESVLWKEIGR
jgi:hypothetical protein